MRYTSFILLLCVTITAKSQIVENTDVFCIIDDKIKVRSRNTNYIAWPVDWLFRKRIKITICGDIISDDFNIDNLKIDVFSSKGRKIQSTNFGYSQRRPFATIPREGSLREKIQKRRIENKDSRCKRNYQYKYRLKDYCVIIRKPVRGRCPCYFAPRSWGYRLEKGNYLIRAQYNTNDTIYRTERVDFIAR